MKALPIGIQDFKDLRTSQIDYIYVDKTEYLYNLATSGKVYFLSRPRRFGKSLMISTLNYLFQGEKELFKGLWIEDKWDWDDKYPVIRVDFSNIAFEYVDELKGIIDSKINIVAQEYEIGLTEENYALRFTELILKLKQKHNKNVVVLIDEYDKPILDHIRKKGLANEIRDVLRGFYSVIKASDEHTKFVMLTGITRFSKVSIFSGLNNLEDITMVNEYSTMLGYTQEELEHYFSEYIDRLAGEMDKSREEILSQIKEWYNGYRFSKKGERVYNPFSTMLLLKQKEFEAHWFETANPKFLIDLISEGDYFLPELENMEVGGEVLESFEIDTLPIEPLLYQTGYLTIESAKIDPRGFWLYKLGLPNKEVQVAFNEHLITYLTNVKPSERLRIQNNLYALLFNGDIEGFERQLKALFASLPYNSYVKNNIAHFEGYYLNVLFTYLAALGVPIIAETTTNRGRMDLTLEFRNKIYIIEVKVGEGSALKQIKEKRYWEKCQNRGKEIVLVGIIFDENERNISKVEWERV